MKPILFTVAGFNVYGYGLMYALSLLVGLFLAEYRAKKHGLNKQFTFNMGLYAIVVGVFGAKLTHLFTVWDQLMADFWTTFKNSIQSGFVVYGGIIAAVICAAIYCKVKKVKFVDYFDLAIPSVAIGQAIGRIGCFLGGCCGGIEVEDASAWYAVTFPGETVARFNVQIFGSILNLLNFVILLIAYKRFKTKGRTAALYMINYGVGRFVIEMLRVEPKTFFEVLSVSQFISIFVTLGGIILMIFAPKWFGSKAVKETEDEPAENDEQAEPESKDEPAENCEQAEPKTESDEETESVTKEEQVETETNDMPANDGANPDADR